MMILGIFAKTFDAPTPIAVMEAARRAGYAAVQYNMACSGLGALPDVVSLADASAVAAASTASGVTVAAVSATYNMIHPDWAARERGRRSFAAIAAAARTMGTGLVTVCTGSRDPVDQWRSHPDNDGAEAWRDVCTEFEHLLPIAERYNVAIGIEPELSNVISSAARARALIDEMQDLHLRIVLDPANLVETATPDERRRIVEDAVDRLGDRIALAHAKDRRADGSFAAAGLGVIDFPHFVATLRRAGYDGALITHGLAAHEAADAAAFLAGAAWAAEGA